MYEAARVAGADAPHIKQELLFREIDRLMMAFKGHQQCVLDFDRGFVNAQLREEAPTKKTGGGNEEYATVFAGIATISSLGYCMLSSIQSK